MQDCQMRKVALKLQAYLFGVRHRKSTEDANADAMSRPCTAVPCPAPAAVVFMTRTLPDFFRDGDFPSITYLEGGGISGPITHSRLGFACTCYDTRSSRPGGAVDAE